MYKLTISIASDGTESHVELFKKDKHAFSLVDWDKEIQDLFDSHGAEPQF